MVQRFIECPCDLCGADDIEVVYEGTIADDDAGPSGADVACTTRVHHSYYRTVKCRGCGLVFASPRHEREQIETAYSTVVDECYVRQREGRVRTFSRNLDNLEKFITPGRLIDIGCHIGVFLDLARKRGWSVTGLEPSSWAAKKADELYNIAVDTGSVFDADYSGADFDAVTMWDVIEHLHSPREALVRIHSWLRPGGVLALSTMDFASLFARLMGRRWPWLMRMHLYYFTPCTISRMLRATGFELIEIRTYVHIISLAYLVRKARSLTGLCLPAADCFNNIYIPFALGDFMEVYARRSGRAYRQDRTGRGL